MLVKSVLFFSIFFTVGVLNSTERLLKGFPGAMQHQNSVKKQDVYQLITGAMVYMADTEQEGYIPKDSKEIFGRIERTIYDYKDTESAYNLNLNMKNSIINAGFEIIYECERLACGDVNAWRLYLTKEIEGSHENQYYIVGKHARKKGGDWYISFYVNDIADRPRSVIDVIHTGKVRPESVVVDHNLLADDLLTKGRVDIPDISFQFNSHRLEKAYYSSLLMVANLLKNNKNMEIIVVGHTDNFGSIEYNKQLSERRANTVMQFLVTEQGVNPKQLSSAGVGSLSPKVNNASKQGRETNRRVEIILQ
tara:strand:+ start:11680 stop:12600 length:921 start_codon:yes stop_codon:yes gene_type:complete